MASAYKYCRYCGDRKHNRWGLKTVYMCSACGHRTCREHLAGNTCLACIAAQRSVEHNRIQEQNRLNQALNRARSWCSSNGYNNHVNAHSIESLRTSLSSIFNSINQTQQSTKQTHQLSINKSTHLVAQLESISSYIESKNANINELKKRIELLNHDMEKERLRSTISRPLGNNAPRLVVFGPMNHGKSSLLNALIERSEYFKVADARQTVDVSEVSHNGIIYRDVPGWDAIDGIDNNTALMGLDNCDVWLYNHDIGVGELNMIDLNCLQKFVQEIASFEQCKLGLLICLSKIDRKKNDLDEIRNKIKNQLDNLIISGKKGLPYLAIVEVSAKDFMTAISPSSSINKREHFIERSGIPNLRTFIDRAVKNRGLISDHNNIRKTALIVNEMLHNQKRSIQENQSKISKIDQHIQQLSSSYNNLVSSI